MNQPTEATGLTNYPTLSARRQAEPGHERRRGDQPQGRAGRPDHHGREPRGIRRQAGYAIPMDKLGRRAVETLKEGKEVEYGLLGIQADPNFTNRVCEVQPNSPAALGQLQVNDEIIAVNGMPVADFDSLILAVNAYPAGETVRLKIRRGDEMIERTIVLAKFPVEGEVIATNRPNALAGPARRLHDRARPIGPSASISWTRRRPGSSSPRSRRDRRPPPPG